MRHFGLNPRHVTELALVTYVGVEVSSALPHAGASERNPAHLPGSARAVLQGTVFRSTQTSAKVQSGQALLALKLKCCKVLKSQPFELLNDLLPSPHTLQPRTVATEMRSLAEF
jgi:hypothetical protein